MRYGNSIMTTYYDDYRGHEEQSCIVIFRDNAVVVEYIRDGKPQTYKGNLVDEEYQLSYWPEVNAFNGIATLSKPEEGLMYGKWVETYPDCTCTGQWEIELRE